MKDASRYRVLFVILVILQDLLLLNALYLGFSQVSDRLVDIRLEVCQVLLVFINMGYLISTLIYPIRVDARNLVQGNILRNALVRMAFTMAIAVSCLFIVKISDQISRAFIILFSIALFIVLVISDNIARGVIHYILKRYESRTKAIILGAGLLGHKLYDEVAANPYLGIHMLGFFDDDPARNGGRLLGSIDQAKEYVLKNEVRQIYCTLPQSARDKIVDLIDFAELNVVEFHVVPALRSYIDLPVVLESVGSMPILSIRKVPLGYAHNAFVKRAFDVAVAGLFLATLFPLIFIVVGIAIKLTSRGPVFFKQERTGMAGKNFYCYKFRSMKVNAAADTAQATANDSRKTPIGDFLRRTSIDELPQFINVLTGDMSIVGPRPHMKFHTSEYSRVVDKYMVRHFIKPGITGLAQVMGYRGETSKTGAMEGRIMRDVWYIEHWTVWLDIRIIWMTVVQAIKGDEKAY